MGLKKLCLAAGLAVVASLVFAPSGLAWTFSASASASCDRTTGEHVIAWSIDNRTEPQALTIRESSRGSIPVGSTVAARSVGQFTERVAGTTTGMLTLTVKGNWPSDLALRTRFAAVTLSGGCVPPPTDLCPNLEGVQEQVPLGLIKDTAGNCTPPPVDVCPNLEGLQTQVPSGMIKDEAGSCITPPTDVCPNLDGVQAHLPSELVKDSAGNCVRPPADLCPNFEGLQASLPPGFVVEANGECAYIQRVVTITVEKTVEVPGPERLISVGAAPVTVERVITKVVIKRAKVARKKAKRAKRKLRPRVLPFTP